MSQSPTVLKLLLSAKPQAAGWPNTRPTDFNAAVQIGYDAVSSAG
jgi:hypothetical protein